MMKGCMSIEYEHLKTGNVYILLGIAADATNGNEGTSYAVYHRKDDPGHPFVREFSEFRNKFKRVVEDDS